MEVCAEGLAGLSALKGKARYDVLVFDNDLPNLCGVELTRMARGLASRRHTPVIMVSAGDAETEAWRAGVDAFLRKPQDIGALVETVRRLVAPRKQHGRRA